MTTIQNKGQVIAQSLEQLPAFDDEYTITKEQMVLFQSRGHTFFTELLRPLKLPLTSRSFSKR